MAPLTLIISSLYVTRSLVATELTVKRSIRSIRHKTVDKYTQPIAKHLTALEGAVLSSIGGSAFYV
jgi:hypothetical protein